MSAQGSPEKGKGSPGKMSASGEKKITPNFTEKLFLNLSGAAAFGDERLLPSVFQEISKSFGASLTQLGVLTFAGALASAMMTPIAGIIGDVAFRGRLLLGALCGIAVTTLLMAVSQDYTHLLIFKILNGLCIGLLVPPLQSVIGDLHEARQRGTAFGYLTFTGILGAIAGAALATMLAAGVYWGVDGWRLAMLVWVAFLLLVITGLWIFAIDDLDKIDSRKVEKIQELEQTPWYSRAGPLLREGYERSKVVLSVPTLQILLVPQAIGGLPWMAFTAWVTFYLEALGFSNAVTAVLILACGSGFALGAFLGGMIGDWADSVDRARGRIACAQISILLGTGAFIFVLEVLPGLCHGQSLWVAGVAYGVSLFVAGIVSIGGTGAACNLPIIMNCLPETHRTSGVGMERFFASIVTSFGGPLVGLIAEGYFGYKMYDPSLGDPATEGEGGDVPTESPFRPLDSRQAMVLGHSLAIVSTISWLIACLVWSFLYFTYGNDRLAQDDDEEEPLDSGGELGYGTSGRQ
mmetsp:Transcript_42430/g.100884  ORF Transcript_42430/g.100884 Transcript_42430/m.100884 type:complete len:521 (+) Transcript_42430:100-1662(+)